MISLQRGTKVITIFGLVTILTLVGCAKPAPVPSPIPSPIPTPVPTPSQTNTPSTAPISALTPIGAYGELRIALSSFGSETFNPIKADAANSYQMLGPMLDYMIMGDGPDLGKNGVVERWELASDALSWTYYIHKGIKFHNGDDLTAKDVKFSLDGYASKDAFNGFLRGMIDHVDVVDDYTVRIYTQGTQPDLPWYTCDLSPAAGTGVVFPKSYIERYGMEYFQSHPIGSGPWKFVNHVLGDMVEYEALDKHWRQAPEFKKLTVILMPEETTRVASLKTGAVDSIDISLESVSELEAAGCRTSSLASYSLAVMLHGAYQQGAGPIGDVRVRQALSLAINRDEIRKSFFYGKAGPPGPPFLSEESRDFDVTYWMDYAAKAFRYDPEEAKRLLTEAGYPNGISIELWSYPIRGATYLPKLAEIVQSYWLKVGVKAQIVPTDDGAFKKIRNTLTSPRLIGQASMNKWGCTTPTPRWLTTGYHPTAGAVALVGNAMPDLTKLIEQSSSEMNPTKRKELIEKAIQITFDSWTDLQIARAPSLIALGPRVDINLPPTAQSVNLFANVAKHRK